MCLVDVSKRADDKYLHEWYQLSIDDEVEPIWTDKHLDELLNDFIVIPKMNLKILKSSSLDVAGIVYCRECVIHGRCAIEGIFSVAKFGEEKRFCGAGEKAEECD